MSAKVKRRMYAECDRSSTLPMCSEAHSTGEDKVKNNAADAIPEIDSVCREAKTEFLLKWSAENMPNTIVKMRKSVQSKKEDRQEKRIVRCTVNEIIFFLV